LSWPAIRRQVPLSVRWRQEPGHRLSLSDATPPSARAALSALLCFLCQFC